MKIPATEYDVEIQALTQEGEAIAGKLRGLQALRAISLCPFHVGDILTDKNGKTARVTGIKAGDYQYDPYLLRGVSFRKDGTEGRPINRFYAWDAWSNQSHKVGDVKQ